MDKILIVGTETVVGANLAAALCEQFQIVALSVGSTVEIAGCQNGISIQHDRTTTRDWIASEWIAAERPDAVILCGPAAQSSWDDPADVSCDKRAIADARNWADACAEFDCRCVLISSDGIFTGPWMFHKEGSQRLCPSTQARTIRSIEQTVLDSNSTALIIRTNAFGWKPGAAGTGWVEQALALLEAEKSGVFDPIRHATPILATDLAEFVSEALQQQLTGTLHVGGAERINPAQFATRLALRFGLSVPRGANVGALAGPSTGFGRGETSLQSGDARQALGMPVPMLDAGIDRLFEQRENGWLDRLNATPTIREKVA